MEDQDRKEVKNEANKQMQIYTRECQLRIHITLRTNILALAQVHHENLAIEQTHRDNVSRRFLKN